MKNTSLCYLERGGQYLMLHRIKKAHDENRDKWIGVGGKFLPGETPEECARRETLEETGLLLEAPEYRGVVDFHCKGWPSERMHLFWADRFSGKLRDCEEGILEWVPVAAVAALPREVERQRLHAADALDERLPLLVARLLLRLHRATPHSMQ